MSEPTCNRSVSADAQLHLLVQQLRMAETNLQAFAHDQVDAVISPMSDTPILLRRAREALAESEVRYRRLLTRMSAVLFELRPDGTICFVNDAAVGITGYKKEEALGQNWWTLFFPGERGADTRDLRAQLAVDDVIGVQIELTAKNGALVTLELNTANRYDSRGRLERIIGLGGDLTAHKKAQEAVRRLNEQLLIQQRHLTHCIMTTQEEERRVISFELHDGLTQYIMSSFAFLDSYTATFTENEDTPWPSELEMGMKYLHEAVIEARRLVNGLRALALDELGLVGSLEQLLVEEQKRSQWEKAELIQDTPIPRFDNILETVAYRVVQEALTNIRKHADATRVQVTFTLETSPDSPERQLAVEVRDWGKGFTVTDKRRHHAHVGLHSMEERVNLLKGSFRIESRPGEGTCVYARFPIDQQNSSATPS